MFRAGVLLLALLLSSACLHSSKPVLVTQVPTPSAPVSWQIPFGRFGDTVAATNESGAKASYAVGPSETLRDCSGTPATVFPVHGRHVLDGALLNATDFYRLSDRRYEWTQVEPDVPDRRRKACAYPGWESFLPHIRGAAAYPFIATFLWGETLENNTTRTFSIGSTSLAVHRIALANGSLQLEATLHALYRRTPIEVQMTFLPNEAYPRALRVVDHGRHPSERDPTLPLDVRWKAVPSAGSGSTLEAPKKPPPGAAFGTGNWSSQQVGGIAIPYPPLDLSLRFPLRDAIALAATDPDLQAYVRSRPTTLLLSASFEEQPLGPPPAGATAQATPDPPTNPSWTLVFGDPQKTRSDPNRGPVIDGIQLQLRQTQGLEATRQVVGSFGAPISAPPTIGNLRTEDHGRFVSLRESLRTFGVSEHIPHVRWGFANAPEQEASPAFFRWTVRPQNMTDLYREAAKNGSARWVESTLAAEHTFTLNESECVMAARPEGSYVHSCSRKEGYLT